jgi:putative spermidine/putrescine transport system substrate-binding protein
MKFLSRKSVVKTFGVIAGLLVSVLSVHANGANEKTTINLYTGGSDNVRVTWEAVLAAFKEKNPDIDVNLQFLASGTGGQGGLDRLISAIKAGQKTTDIDILETADNDIGRILSEAGPDALTVIDESKVPNSRNILQKSAVGGDRAIAFRGTTVLVAYDSAKIAIPPKTAAELYAWIKANPGRFAYNDPTTGGSGSSFVVTASYNFLPPEALTSSDPVWKTKWNQGFSLLKELHPSFYKASGKVQYPAKNQGTLDLLATGEVWMIPAWADMVLDQKSRNLLPQTVRLTQIEPAFTGGIQTMVVPALSAKKEASFKLLNFVASSEGQQIFVEKMKAIPVIDTAALAKSTVDMLSGLQVKGFRTYTIGKLGEDMMRRWQEEIATLP